LKPGSAFSKANLRFAMVVKALGIKYFDVSCRNGGQEATKQLSDIELTYNAPTKTRFRADCTTDASFAGALSTAARARTVWGSSPRTSRRPVARRTRIVGASARLEPSPSILSDTTNQDSNAYAARRRRRDEQ
jgi:rhamnose transport system substrate-binding protein